MWGLLIITPFPLVPYAVVAIKHDWHFWCGTLYRSNKEPVNTSRISNFLRSSTMWSEQRNSRVYNRVSQCVSNVIFIISFNFWILPFPSNGMSKLTYYSFQSLLGSLTSFVYIVCFLVIGAGRTYPVAQSKNQATIENTISTASKSLLSSISITSII